MRCICSLSFFLYISNTLSPQNTPDYNKKFVAVVLYVVKNTKTPRVHQKQKAFHQTIHFSSCAVCSLPLVFVFVVSCFTPKTKTRSIVFCARKLKRNPSIHNRSIGLKAVGRSEYRTKKKRYSKKCTQNVNFTTSYIQTTTTNSSINPKQPAIAKKRKKNKSSVCHLVCITCPLPRILNVCIRLTNIHIYNTRRFLLFFFFRNMCLLSALLHSNISTTTPLLLLSHQ